MILVTVVPDCVKVRVVGGTTDKEVTVVKDPGKVDNEISVNVSVTVVKTGIEVV